MTLANMDLFRQSTIKHPHLEKALNDLRLRVRQAESGTILFLYGPSGVGKTTLLKYIVAQMAKEDVESGTTTPGCFPAAYVEAPAPETGKFSWKEFYRRMLYDLWEPVPHKKLPDIPWRNQFLLNSNAPAHALRKAVENALEHRKVKVLLIDEAQHIGKGNSGGGSLWDQLDYIKSIANLTKSVIVLGGTYQLLAFRNLSAQLSRRSIDVHFPRYRADEESDYKIFLSVIASFEQRLPCPCTPRLLDQGEYLYTGSVGCVGILKTWLNRALEASVLAGNDSLTQRVLEESSYSYDQLETMTAELLDGEAIIARNTRPLTGLHARLGINELTEPIDVRSANSLTKTAQKRTLPGTRKPTRDAVGGGQP